VLEDDAADAAADGAGSVREKEGVVSATIAAVLLSFTAKKMEGIELYLSLALCRYLANSHKSCDLLLSIHSSATLHNELTADLDACIS